MTFEELNAEMKALVESENYEKARDLLELEKRSIEIFNCKQKYSIYEKVMIIQYKNSLFEESLMINEFLSSLASTLEEQYVFTTDFWRINIELAQKNYSTAAYNANMLISKLPKTGAYVQKLKSEIQNTILRVYIETGKYARMKKMLKKMLQEDLDVHSKSKMLMNVGVAYYSLGKYNVSIILFLKILSLTEDVFFVGCSNLYIARMVSVEQKRKYYDMAIDNFEKINNKHLLNICKQEIDDISGCYR